MIDLSKWNVQDLLRKTEIAYITDPVRRPLDYWYLELCKEEMPIEDLESRASTARWASRRDEYWAEVQQAVLEQAKFAAVKDRVDEMREIQSVRANTLELIQPRIIDGQKIYRVHPSSYEGMVRALCTVDALVDTKRDAILSMVEPDLRTKGHTTVSPLTAEETRQFVRLLLESRRSNQGTSLLPRGDQDDPNDPVD